MVSNSFQTAVNALLSSCPLNPKGREDHINFSSLGIFVLLFPVLCTHNLTAIIGGLLIVYLAWSIFYLNSPRTKKLFQV